MDDESLRGVIARCFASQAAVIHCDDLDEHIEVARKLERWIMTGEYVPANFAQFASVAEACLARAQQANKAAKGGKK